MRLPKAVLTAAEAEQVIAQTNVHDVLGLRDRAILETFYSTGMRRLELVNFKLWDLDLERATATIHQGKGHKDRMIPLGDRAAAWVRKYIEESRPQLVSEPDDAVVFLSNAGEPFSLDYLTEVVRGYVEKADIGKQGACHLFRHTMATLMLEGGADIRFIQAMLGHADLKTTQIYAHVAIRQLQEIHRATHPAKLERDRRELAVPAQPLHPRAQRFGRFGVVEDGEPGLPCGDFIDDPQRLGPLILVRRPAQQTRDRREAGQQRRFGLGLDPDAEPIALAAQFRELPGHLRFADAGQSMKRGERGYSTVVQRGVDLGDQLGAVLEVLGGARDAPDGLRLGLPVKLRVEL
ncbi:MAG: tyrosine-type recombinase/integrase [Bryobacteraceae bacterium]